MKKTLSVYGAVASSVSAFALCLGAPGAFAQSSATAAATTSDEIVVTATRRSASVQDVPLNISAIGANDLAEQGLQDLSEIGQVVPGLQIIDQGARNAQIVVRGLNLDGLAANDGDNDGGGTVATYFGETPLFGNFRLRDIERVEVLLGPQGTLYGSGTLGGAIRYIPNKPDFDGFSGQLRGSVYGYEKAEGLSNDLGFTINVPLARNLAFRASLDRLEDTGFINQPFRVRQIGISDPDPAPGTEGANLKSVKDVNSEDILTGRAALRWAPAAWLDGTLTYFYEKVESGGRQISGLRSTLQTDEFDSPLRVDEELERENQLLALEFTADLGFAELTSATAQSKYEDLDRRDQTDLLITLAYSYEAFPTFTAFTRDDLQEDRFNQEIRLVSTHGGPLSWIVGAFYNKFESEGFSREFTPFINGSGPMPLEFFSAEFEDRTEQAIFGELTYQLTPKWSVTGGFRVYEFELDTRQATDLPLLDGRGDTQEVILDFESASVSDEGELFKFNTSYQFTDDILGYLTVSEGYRIGGSNGLVPCTNTGQQQSVCGQSDELLFTPDQTRNYELGLKTALLDRRLILNGSAYYIEWQDPQISSATLIGLQPITKNGEGAETAGLDLSFDFDMTEKFNLRGAYSYLDAKLTDTAERAIRVLDPDSFSAGAPGAGFIDGQAGDRLPGSPENQASLFGTFRETLPNGLAWTVSGGAIYKSNILTRIGGRGDSFTLPAYTLTNVSTSLEGDAWKATLFVENLFNEFIEVGSRATPDFNRILTDSDGGPVRVRSFVTQVLPPRSVGVRLTYDF